MIFVFLLIALFTTLIIFVLQQAWKFRTIRHFPGPPDVCWLALLYRLSDRKNILRNLSRMRNIYGSIVRVALSPTNYVLLVTDREMVEFFLRSPKYMRKSFNYKFFFPWLGIEGILTAEGSTWHSLRKLWTPAFHFQMLEHYLPIFDSSSNTLLQILEQHDGKEEFNIYPNIALFTLDIIVETATVAKINAQLYPKNDFVHSVHFLTDNIMKRTIHPWKRFDFLYQFTNDCKQEKKCIEKLNDITDNIIIERRKRLLQDKENTNQFGYVFDSESKNKSILIDILLQSNIDGEPLSDHDIKNAINGILFAGQDTTASTISLMIYELANNLEVQNKMVEELKTIFGNDKDRPATMYELNQLKYMDLVIKEVIRIYSPVPLIGRTLAEDVDYKGTILPEGLTLAFFIYGLHRSPELYENPKIFNPERFLSDNKIEPYSYIPFSAGPRNCLGQKYAVSEVKVTFAKLLRHYEFLSAGPDYEVQLSPEAVMKSLNGIVIKIRKRQF